MERALFPSHTTLQPRQDLWIPEDSQLLEFMLAYDNNRFDPKVIQGEIRQCQFRIKHEQYPFPALYHKCNELTGRGALYLCNDYFSYLTRASSLDAWLSPMIIADLAITHGERAVAECKSQQEVDEVAHLIAPLLSWVAKTAETTHNLLALLPLNPNSKVIDEVAVGVIQINLFDEVVISQCRREGVKPQETLSAADTYFSQFPSFSLTRSLALCFKERLAALVMNEGAGALSGCKDLQERAQMRSLLTALLGRIPGTAEAVRNLLAHAPRTSDSEIIAEVTEEVMQIDLFDAAVRESRRDPKVGTVLTTAREYAVRLLSAPHSPSLRQCIQEKLAMLVANEGMISINGCHTVSGFQELSSAINDLFHFFPESRPYAKQIAEALPDCVSKALLLKILDGLQGSALFLEVVIRTQDNIFTSEEWNNLGHFCLPPPRPARLWLAIGANATQQHIVRVATREAHIALNNNGFVWSSRRGSLLMRLIANIDRFSHAQARTLEGVGQRREWIVPPYYLSPVEMEQLNRPSRVEDRQRLINLALSLHHSDRITEGEALRLWSLGENCGDWDRKMRIRWLSHHTKIAQRLNSNTLLACVNAKWDEISNRPE
jgi:hypothetical protein